MAFAYSLTLSARQLTVCLSSLDAHFEQAILEGVADICFVGVARVPHNFQFDDAFTPQHWERGRAFGVHTELRWRRRGDAFVVLLIAEAPVTIPTSAQQEIETLPEPVQLDRVQDEPPLRAILWGEWQNPTDPMMRRDLPDLHRDWWYEERIPKFLDYPYYASVTTLAVEVARYRVLSQMVVDTPGDFVYRFVQLVHL